MPSVGEWARQCAATREVRKLAGLGATQGLHPAPTVFHTQAEAIKCFHDLVDKGDYAPAQLGVFAQEVSDTGKRKFLVDTYAGFALESAPGFSKGGAFAELAEEAPVPCGAREHLYEIILEDRPCWWYFDLEYSRDANPTLDPEVAMQAFRRVLRSFCSQRLGAPPDESGIIELDSSTPKKFSKHLLVQRLHASSSSSGADSGADEASSRDLAFANNAQAGFLTEQLLEFARAHRNDPNLPAAHLFVQAPPSQRGHCSDEVSLIDESVYSRNRCFRLLFHAKFGKTATLEMSASSTRAAFGRSLYPPLHLLRTMASLVTDDIVLFSHPLIPPGCCHGSFKGHRASAPGPSTSAWGVNSKRMDATDQDGLLQYLVEKWDEVRQVHERSTPLQGQVTRVQSVVQMDGRFWVVTLVNNRFCFCKGASHRSNHVYLVVDRDGQTFHQKCYDPDCKYFQPPKFPLPEWLVESEREADLWDSVIQNAFAQTSGPAAAAADLLMRAGSQGGAGQGLPAG